MFIYLFFCVDYDYDTPIIISDRFDIVIMKIDECAIISRPKPSAYMFLIQAIVEQRVYSDTSLESSCNYNI